MTFLTGTGRHRAQIIYFFRMQIGSRARSGIGLGSGGHLDRIRRCLVLSGSKTLGTGLLGPVLICIQPAVRPCGAGRMLFARTTVWRTTRTGDSSVEACDTVLRVFSKYHCVRTGVVSCRHAYTSDHRKPAQARALFRPVIFRLRRNHC